MTGKPALRASHACATTWRSAPRPLSPLTCARSSRAGRPDCTLTELLLFGPQVAAEAAGVPYVVLNPTINVVPAPGVPPFGQGFMPAETDADRERDRMAGEAGM